MSNKDSFDDFFNDSDINLDDPQFPDDDFNLDDDALLADETTEEEGGGISRTFLLLLGLLAIIFVILVAVVAAIALGGGETCDANCQLATQIVATNNQISTEIRASETAISIQSTATQQQVETISAESTATAIVASTETQVAVEAAIAATDTQIAQDSTATQVAVNDQVAQTQTAVAIEAFTDTPTPVQEVIAQVRDENNQPAREGLVICIFRDNGDGEFNPSGAVDNPNCSPTVGQGASGADTTSAGSDTTTTDPATEEAAPAATATTGLNPIFQTATANAGGAVAPAGSDTTSGSGAAPQASATPQSGGAAPSGLNPIFQTATAAAASRGGGSLPTPTPEGSSNNGFRSLSRVLPDNNRPQAAQPVGEDEFVGDLVIDANGNITLPSLPPGEYWFSIGSQEFNINVTDTVSTQTFTFPVDGQPGETITITVPGANAENQPATADPGTGGQVAPIFQTATALAAQGGGVASPTPAVEVTTTGEVGMPTTGFFDGTNEVGAIDLLVLAVIGAILIAVVITARRMRMSA